MREVEGGENRTESVNTVMRLTMHINTDLGKKSDRQERDDICIWESAHQRNNNAIP